ncbi:hypothetical protein NW765_004956 [Fusarium oxysporum]|nr:hypothetical protein NW765_004956 [Fusarium oxysporum]KAJ4281243.1 hypothetical protein NW764_003937 [Fusarium oxysporum]
MPPHTVHFTPRLISNQSINQPLTSFYYLQQAPYLNILLSPARTMSQITDESLREAIKQRLEATHVEVTDMSGGCGQAFNSVIVSPQFQGLNSLKRHRLVNAALKDEIAIIHAWTAKCQTPEEYAKTSAANDTAQAQP